MAKVPVTSVSDTTHTVHTDYETFSKSVIQTVASNHVGFLNILWNNVVNATPKHSGTLKFGWRMQVNSPSVFVPMILKEEGAYDDPPQPDFLKYKNIHKYVYLNNNVPYVGFVNDGISGNGSNFNFIDRAIDISIDEWLSSQGF